RAAAVGLVDVGCEPGPVARRHHDVAVDFHRGSPPLPALGISAKSSRRSAMARARSSAGEHYVDIVGVTGSIPVAPTISYKDLDEPSLNASEIRKHTGSSRTAPRLAGVKVAGLQSLLPLGSISASLIAICCARLRSAFYW